MNSHDLLPHETQRLILRRFTEADLPAFVAYRADPEVARYQSWSDYDMPKARDFLRGQHAAGFGDPGQWVQIAVQSQATGVLLGDVVLKVLEDDNRQAELGATFDRRHQGQGYATEAVAALLDLAFEGLSLHRVFGITDALNLPSAALMRRLGFRQEGHFIQNIFFKGAWGDELQFAMLASEWAEKKRR